MIYSKNKGITLIALVITIIIMLILSGIAITQLAGNNLFNKVQLAKEISEESQDKENIVLGNYENTINSYLSSSREQIMVDKEEYNTLKKDVEELKNQISKLQVKTTLKTLYEEKKDVSAANGEFVNVFSITIPEDCYADIYSFYNLSNNDSKEYKGIFLYKNDDRIAQNGKGGVGGQTQNDISCTSELKAGDVITMKLQQFTGQTQTILNSYIRINYFPK